MLPYAILIVILIGLAAAQSSSTSKLIPPKSISLANGYVELIVELDGVAWVSSLKADFNGRSNYGKNLLAEKGGIRLERIESGGEITFPLTC